MNPFLIRWRDCCSHPACHRKVPIGFGMFYDGSGFGVEEVELLNAAFAAYREKWLETAPITSNELEVLEMVRGDREPRSGAWVNACLEHLRGSGYITNYIGVKPQLTPKGEEIFK